MRADSTRTLRRSRCLARVVIHDVQLHVRRGDKDLRARSVQRQERDDRLVDLAAVEDAATGQDDADLCHGAPPAAPRGQDSGLARRVKPAASSSYCAGPPRKLRQYCRMANFQIEISNIIYSFNFVAHLLG